MSIDGWTIALEAVNFLVLVWLLERLLYRPVLGVIDRRQAEIERLQQADTAAQQALSEERQRLETERQALASDRARALEEAHTQARQERARAQAEAHAETEQLLNAGRARLEHERADVAHALRRKSAEIGVSIARRLLSSSIPPGGDSHFIESACEQLRTMDTGDRSRLAASLGEDTKVEVITAQALDPDQQASCSERIAKSLGHAVDISFSADASLIAGIELVFPGLVLRHSWRDALADGEAALIEAAEQASLAGAENGDATR